ncbi:MULTISPECIES: head-tail connector protein [unclassified Mesorhizobium]|uniref:head-tail connector protein n=1 Tax=unclassified Mesorhizobium TaxID=325217 RepID=UPI0011287B54|nr:MULTISPECIES: head-tail connector protein [unclassified Mesorhizobium]TPJ86951.1 phage gp6-like head-tail connector protein [Mesorhizobium sp. B2-5-12]TPK19174.1 phage gp6-like head-tail connector protein [Mesorhizobium sp. B2-5-6]
MSLLDIALVKKHLRIDFDDDDDTISAYQAAAETIVTEYVDRAVYAAGGMPATGDDGTAIEVTPAITAAILLLIGDLYESREADPESKGDAVLPRAVRALLAPYRVWRVLDECTYVEVTT